MYLVLQILLAIKNNNVKKIPNYDPEHQLHLQKILRNFLRAGAAVTPMKIGYDELIRAGQVSTFRECQNVKMSISVFLKHS